MKEWVFKIPHHSSLEWVLIVFTPALHQIVTSRPDVRVRRTPWPFESQRETALEGLGLGVTVGVWGSGAGGSGSGSGVDESADATTASLD